MTHGDKIRQIRESKGLTQEDIEKKTGLNQSTVSHIERGKRPGELATLNKICKAMGVTLSDIFADSDPETTKYMNIISEILEKYPDFDKIIDAAFRATEEDNPKILFREFDNFVEKHEKD